MGHSGNFVWRSIIPRVSHEGLAFDKNRTLYFVDELNGGSIYKYVSAAPYATTGDEYFAGSDGNSRTYTLNLATNAVKLFASPQSIDLATGAAVGGALRNADNLAIDAEGNMYIVEDRNGGSDDDIWLAVDLNKDGDITDPGEGLARWVSNGAQGSEFTGLYFDFRQPNRAFVNIQHPSSGNDRLIEISTEPAYQVGNK